MENSIEEIQDWKIGRDGFDEHFEDKREKYRCVQEAVYSPTSVRSYEKSVEIMSTMPPVVRNSACFDEKCPMNGKGTSMLGISASAAEMQEADRRAIHDVGIPGSVLMYNAGKSVADLLSRDYPSGHVAILAGKGNNAGDGFVIAHILHNQGRPVRVIALANAENYTGDALLYLSLCMKQGIDIRFTPDAESAKHEITNLNEFDVIVDALLGTGIKGTVREPFFTAISSIPKKPVISVDLPSGMDADTGSICGVAVKADQTVTFVAPKHGLLKNPELVGKLHVADIGMPKMCLSHFAH